MKLLYVCTHNACRSVLSEVITRARAGERLAVASAGSNPAGRIHPLTLEALQAGGYSTQGLSSKGFEALSAFAPDVVVTVCDSAAQEPCPVWLGPAIKAHWGLPDPSHLAGSEEQRRTAFAAVMATISRRVEALLEQPLETLGKKELEDVMQQIGEIN